MNKFQILDDAICAHISAGGCHPTNSSALETVARQLIDLGIGGKSPFPVWWRLVDRRMQAMRKAGRLQYERTKGGGHGKWRVVEC